MQLTREKNLSYFTASVTARKLHLRSSPTKCWAATSTTASTSFSTETTRPHGIDCSLEAKEWFSVGASIMCWLTELTTPSSAYTVQTMKCELMWRNQTYSTQNRLLSIKTVNNVFDSWKNYHISMHMLHTEQNIDLLHRELSHLDKIIVNSRAKLYNILSQISTKIVGQTVCNYIFLVIAKNLIPWGIIPWSKTYMLNTEILNTKAYSE